MHKIMHEIAQIGPKNRLQRRYATDSDDKFATQDRPSGRLAPVPFQQSEIVPVITPPIGVRTPL